MIEANILVGFAWNDRPWIGMTAIVTAESDLDLARVGRHGTRAARSGRGAPTSSFGWRRRRARGIEASRASTRTGRSSSRIPATTPTAGAAGDLTTVLQAALDIPELDDVVIAGITAPGDRRRPVSRRASGATVTLDLGAEHVSAPKIIVRRGRWSRRSARR